MNSFKLLSNEISKWQADTFKSSDPFSKLNHLKEELIELEFELSENNRDKIEKELADCQILLIGIASLYGIYLDDAAELKFEIIKKRKWGNPDENGIVRHIKQDN